MHFVKDIVLEITHFPKHTHTHSHLPANFKVTNKLPEIEQNLCTVVLTRLWLNHGSLVLQFSIVNRYTPRRQCFSQSNRI